jgi:hypothetical protein
MSDEWFPQRRLRLTFKDNFAVGMRAAADAAGVPNRNLALLDATWEPHDWSDFA